MDQNSNSVVINQLGGVAYNRDTGTFWAVQDNSNHVMELSVSFNTDGTFASVGIASALTLFQSNDFEGIAYTNATRNSIFLSEENSPGVREFSLDDGSLLQTLNTPAVCGTP